MAFSIPVGHKFLPTDKQLIGYYLFNKILTQIPPFSDHEKSLVKDFDLYGSFEPWEIWQLHGGDNLEDDQALSFFTPLKKISVNGSRICRRVGSGTWAGEDSGDKIKAGKVVGLKKRFRYENPHSPHDGAWIMHEFAIHSVLSRQQQKPDHIVLCRLKNNMRGSDKKRKSKEDNFEQSKSCKFTVPIPVQTLSLTDLIVQASEPEPEDQNLMFNPQELLSTLEVPLLLSSTVEAESYAGESDHLLDVQDNTLQPRITTTQAEADNNWVDAEDGWPLSTIMSSSPRDVDGRDCFWENIIKHLPSLNPDDMMPTTACFKLTDAGDWENAVDAHHNMLQPPITTTQAEADYNLVAEDAMPLSTVVSSSPCDVDGDDCSWENMMRDITLPDPDDMIDIPSSGFADFWELEVSQMES
uniref:NAC transcription factor 93 n=1 Tax=Litchi chinensis TaxID=151069 RepID=A0A8K1MD21_LITCN|nr:NAC transcription factor 93 [Litchi chinensis]